MAMYKHARTRIRSYGGSAEMYHIIEADILHYTEGSMKGDTFLVMCLRTKEVFV